MNLAEIYLFTEQLRKNWFCLHSVRKKPCVASPVFHTKRELDYPINQINQTLGSYLEYTQNCDSSKECSLCRISNFLCELLFLPNKK